MSLKPQAVCPVPPETARVARAAYPKGNLYMQMRNVLGSIYTDEDFTNLFPKEGQPAEAPWRLALVTVMQFVENLSDRQAADAVRGRIDWKYLLGLSLTDPGFDASVLSEFRSRLVEKHAEELLLEKMPLFGQKGWLKARGRQRTEESQRDYQIDLVGPTRKNYRWQASQQTGYDADHFFIDWEQQRATCPQGHTSNSWTPAIDKRKNEVIKIKFSTTDCQNCPARLLCTQSSRPPRRTITIRPEARYLALKQRREQEKTKEFKEAYAKRAGIEGTLSQGVRVMGLRRSRYIGQEKTHLQHVAAAAALNIVRCLAWVNALPRAQTRRSPFARLYDIA